MAAMTKQERFSPTPIPSLLPPSFCPSFFPNSSPPPPPPRLAPCPTPLGKFSDICPFCIWQPEGPRQAWGLSVSWSRADKAPPVLFWAAKIPAAPRRSDHQFWFQRASVPEQLLSCWCCGWKTAPFRLRSALCLLPSHLKYPYGVGTPRG